MNNVWFWVCVVVVIGLVFEVVDEVRRYKRRVEKRDNWRLYYVYGRSMLGFYRSGNWKLENNYKELRREVLKRLSKNWSDWKEWNDWRVEEGERKSSDYVRYI